MTRDRIKNDHKTEIDVGSGVFSSLSIKQIKKRFASWKAKGNVMVEGRKNVWHRDAG